MKKIILWLMMALILIGSAIAPLELGVSSGFVTETPTANPDDETAWVGDDWATVSHDTSPATAGKITEVGFYRDGNAVSDYQIGLYAADGATVPGEAGTLLYMVEGATAGGANQWETETVDWAIDPSTGYWLGVQIDDSGVSIRTFAKYSTATGLDYKGAGVTELPNPFGMGALFQATGMLGLYAIWEAGVDNCYVDGTIDITSHEHQGQSYIWLDNMAKNNTNVTKIVTDGLVSYYDLNENAGDRQGSNDGTITGAVNTTGHLGVSNTSLSFDGDDNVNVGDVIELNSAEYFTVSYWLKKADDKGYTTLSKIKDSDERLVIHNTASSGTDRQYFYVENVSTSYGYLVSYSTIVPKDEWHHQLWIYDGTGSANVDRLKFYIDGVQRTLSFSGTIPTMTADLSSKNTLIGTSFNGSIDNLRIYNRTLSAEEIKALYEERNDNHTNGSFSVAFCIKDCINETGLVAQWELNGNALDRMNNYNGTISGAVNASNCRYGNCMNFDGVNDNITISGVIINNTNNYSISVWTKPDTITASSNKFFSQDDGNSKIYMSTFLVSGQNRLYWYASLNAENYKYIYTGDVAKTDIWQHMVGVSNNGDMSIYLNGVKQSVTEDSAGSFPTLYTGNTYFGLASDGTPYNGSIDNVLIYNRSLSQEEVYKLYLSGYEHHLPDASLKKIEYDGDVGGSCYFFDNPTNNNFSYTLNYNYSNWLGYYTNYTNVTMTPYSSGETINSNDDYGICELAGTYFNYLNLTFGDYCSVDGTNTAYTNDIFSCTNFDVYNYGNASFNNFNMSVTNPITIEKGSRIIRDLSSNIIIG